MYKRNNIIL